MKKKPKTRAGWREWVSLPGLGVDRIKAKLDTGARTSALHAFDIRRYRRGDRTFVRFKVHPIQDDTQVTVEGRAEMVEERPIKSSSGHVTRRPVVELAIGLMGERLEAEVTLVARDEMGFRMLIGRSALKKGRFVVDPGRSYLGGKKTP